ncbi:MAG TPA: ABC transporter ATP-binding protein [Jiangellaceae bacterium]|nr:ABC transporter ATP-binding protein [Jiangellaceae bacterium]
MNGGDCVVTVRGAVAVLAHRSVLHGVDLTVPAGQVVALLGPNGSGKSTLVRAAIGLIPLAAGEVRLFRTPLARFRDWGRIGYVPQRTTAASGVPATVREVVASGRLARRRPFWPATARDRQAVDRAIELVGLSDRADDSVAALSGGQQQRVLIARAAATDPDLLVLDEPNAGVDLPSQEAFARALRTFVASGRSVLVVLHEMGPLEQLIDRAVVLRDGQVIHDGPLPVPTSVTGDGQHYHANSPRAAEEGLFG